MAANETPLQKALRKLALWEAAEDAIAIAGQSYTISNRQYTRADLNEVRAMVAYYENKVAQLQRGSRGARVQRFIPIDK